MIVVSETKNAELIAALNEEVQNLHARLHPDMFKPYDRVAMTNAMNKFVQDENCRAYVAEADGSPAGYALLFIREIKENAFHYNLKTLYLDQLAVLAQYRRTGVGSVLMEQVEKLARDLSIQKIELDHWSANSLAASYFRKNGYALYKERLYKMV